MQFGCLRMILVMRSVVIASRHKLKSGHSARLGVGFLSEFVGLVRILQRSVRMPLSSFIIAFFIMFGSGAMSARRKFVLLGGLQVCVVHVVSSR